MTFLVSLTVPRGASVREAREYISEAVRQWRHVPETGIMSSLDPDSVWVAKV